MNICLTHWSALECWRRIRQGGIAAVDIMLNERNARLPRNEAPTITYREAEQLSKHLDLTLPLQLAIAQQLKRNKRSYCSFFRFKEKPGLPIDVCEFEEGVFLPYPETVYIQLAPTLSVLDQAKLGYELTSSYVLMPGGATFETSVPLLDIQRLERQTTICSKRARRIIARASDLFMPGAESPAEINLALKLLLPSCHGGFGLQGARLNPRIDLGQQAQAITGKTHCRADVLFEDAKIDIEYDSKTWHSTEKQQTEDMKRRMALRGDGYKVIPITADDLGDADKLLEVAKEVSKAQGRRLRLSGKCFSEKQNTLFKALNSGFVPVSRP